MAHMFGDFGETELTIPFFGWTWKWKIFGWLKPLFGLNRYECVDLGKTVSELIDKVEQHFLVDRIDPHTREVIHVAKKPEDLKLIIALG